MNKIEWDPHKAETNLRKHGISFDEAITVFLDPWALTFDDPEDRGEDRELTIGFSALGKILLVVHLEKESGRIRVISARKATKQERSFYEEGI